MTDFPALNPGANTQPRAEAAGLASLQPCEECVGTGGWYRYEPALDATPGMLYLSCLHCRGSGRLALPRG